MASTLDLIKHYQHAMEKNVMDNHKVVKCIDKLFSLDVTVQHLQDTGVGRTVNALRKEPGEVGQAARALVNKWKTMVAAEASDHEGDNDTVTHNGTNSGRDSDDNANYREKLIKQEYVGNTSKTTQNTSIENTNGHYSGSKRNYQSSEEEPEIKKSKHSSYSTNENCAIKHKKQIKNESSDQESVSKSHSDESESELSESSQEQEKRVTIKKEPSDEVLSLQNSFDNDHNKKSSNSKNHESIVKHSKHDSSKSKPTDRSHSKDKSHFSKHDHSKSHKSSHKSSNKDKEKSDKDEFKSSRHSSSSDKHKTSKSKQDSSSGQHKIKLVDSSDTNKNDSDRHSKQSSSDAAQKSKKHKHRTSSEKEISNENHISRHSNSSKDRHSSSSKEKSKDRSSSLKEKSSDSHKSENKHSSHRSKSKSDKSDKKHSERKSKHESNSSSHKSSKSSSTKTKEDDIPKTKQANSEDSEDGIDCGSGASFAEALGMISPTKPKKKMPLTKNSSPNSSYNQDMSPANLLAPTTKLAPLPALEISALPEISPNYRPRPPPKLLPHFTEDEAMSAVISSKNQRTKVYSGNKILGRVPTLFEMCVTILQEHIDALEFTGGVPYEILKPVVDKATPQQLFNLEHFNPYLMDDTDHLWQKFCEKDFRKQQRQELETWREMYMRCQEEQEHRLKHLTNNIKIAQEAKRAPIKQTKMAYVDSVVKPPRNVARKQALHGTSRAAAASPAARVASLAGAPLVRGGAERPGPAPVTLSALARPKKAPLMQKALQLLRGRKR